MTTTGRSDVLSASGLGALAALRNLAPSLRRQRRGVLLTVAVAFANEVSGIAVAAVAAWVTGQVAFGAEAAYLTPWVFALVALALTKGALVWIESWVAHDMAFRVMAGLRADVYEGLDRLAPAWLLGKRTGDVASTALSDVEALEWFYAHTVAQVVTAIATPIGALVVLGFIDIRLALVFAPFVVLLISVPLTSLRRGEREGRELREGLAHLHAETTDLLQGVREVALLGDANRWMARLATAASNLSRAQRSQASRIGREAGISEAIMAGAMVAVLVTGGLLAEQGDLDRSNYPIAVMIAGLSLTPLMVIAGGLRNLGLLRATASRVSTVLQTEARVSDPAHATAVAEAVLTTAGAEEANEPAAPSVHFQEVCFGYIDDQPVLKQTTFDVTSGSTVALVGVSGAGKSTCANLLIRFWDPQDGRILLGATDLRDLSLHELRRTVSLVPQNPYLFRGTIADNLRLADPAATHAEIRRAAEDALVTEFTDTLPDGLDTVIGERGSTLSGGQRQRIALAQALLRNAQVLILDEAVAEIDAQGEAELQEAISRARRGRTTIVIAHRLATIASSDRAIMLDEGQVVETGPPDQLLRTDGPFTKLVARQLD
ncbi:MAG: ABC transporter ATP-binding protein [Actinomycetota bacterium]